MEVNNNTLSDTYNQNNPYKLITRRIDSMKIRHNHKRDVEVNVSFAGDLEIIKGTPVRSGAIIYTHDGTQTYFCLGVDTQSGNLTDFGGGVKKTESIVEGGLRELEEESQGVFGHIEQSSIKDTVTFHSYNMAIMFIPMEVDRNEIYQKFRKKIVDNPSPEVCDIVWLDKQDFMESIHGRGQKLYIRVRRLLNKVTTTISEL